MSRGNNSLRIGVAATTRFHMFDLARELRALGEDVRLFTALPRWKIDTGLRDVAEARPSRLVQWRVAARIPYVRRSNAWENRTFAGLGHWIAGRVGGAGFDVLDALDGLGSEAGPIVKREGAVWVCNRGSAHVLTQREILTEEHSRWNQPMPSSYFDPWMVDRCLAEYAAANAIVVPSSFARKSFLERGFRPESVFVCPYGVDLAMFKPERKEDDRFRVIFVGAQSIQKGIGYLFDALRPLVQAGRIELWLVGPATPDGRAILERNSDLFIHHGVQPRSRLSWFYSQASVLVLPSVQEGLALVQAQAMACGVPVIASANTGAEDLFTDGAEGFIVPARDSAAIRERVAFLLDTPRRLEEMGKSALRRVHHLGGWSRYGERCREVYRQLCGTASQAVCS